MMQGLKALINLYTTARMDASDIDDVFDGDW
jgi:hypothetical protein